MANMYFYGQGVPQGYAEAIKWLRMAADQGHARADYNLGTMYANGQEVPQDYAEAAKRYLIAADQGHAGAQYNLEVMHQQGQGVPQDYVQAHMWLSVSAYNTTGEIHDAAMKLRESVAEQMTPEQIAEAQRLAKEWMIKTNSIK